MGGNGFFKRVEVEVCFATNVERIAHEAGQNDGAQVAAAIARQRLFATRVGSSDVFAIPQVVIAVDLVNEQNTRLGEVVSRLHDGIPQLLRVDFAVNPQAVCALVAAFFQYFDTRLGFVDQFPVAAVIDGLHKAIAHTHRNVEVVPTTRGALGGNEFQYIGVVDAQYAHLCATACTCRLYGRAALVEHVHVAARAAGDTVCAFNFGAFRANARKIVAYTTATAHGLCGFTQGFINAWETFVIVALDAVAHRLHKAVDQGGLNGGACGTHDTACADSTSTQVVEKLGFPLGLEFRFFYAGQSTRYTHIDLVSAAFALFAILLQQHVVADRLFGEWCGSRGLSSGLHGIGIRRVSWRT